MKKLFLLLACLGLMTSCASKPEYIEPPALSLDQPAEAAGDQII